MSHSVQPTVDPEKGGAGEHKEALPDAFTSGSAQPSPEEQISKNNVKDEGIVHASPPRSVHGISVCL